MTVPSNPSAPINFRIDGTKLVVIDSDITEVCLSDGTTCTEIGGGGGGGGGEIIAQDTGVAAISTTPVTINFNSKSGDTNNELTQSTGLFTADGDGIRTVEWYITWANNGGFFKTWEIHLNGTLLYGGNFSGSSLSVGNVNIPFTHLYSDGDTVQLKVASTSTNGTLLGSSTKTLAPFMRIITLS